MKFADKLGYLVKHSALYTFSQILARLSGFLLMPLFTNTSLVSIHEYSAYGFFVTTAVISTSLFSLGMESALVRYLKHDEEKRSHVVNSAITAILFSVLLIITLNLSFNQWIATYAIQDSEMLSMALALGFLVSLDLLTNLPVNYYRADERPSLFVLFRIFRTLLELSIIYYAIIELEMGIMGAVYGLMTAAAINLLVLLPFYLKHYRFTFDKTYIKRLLKFGLPLLPASVLFMLIEVSGRYFLNQLVSKEVQTAFMNIYKFGAILSILNYGFRSAWQPIMLRESKTSDSDYYVRVMNYFMIVSTSVMIITSLLALDVIRYNPLAFIRSIISDPFYYSEGHVIALILAGYVCLGMYYNLSYVFYLKERSKELAFIACVGFAINIAINSTMSLAPEYGTIISATATFSSFFIMLIIAFIRSQKLYYIPYELKKIVIMGLYVVFICIITVSEMGIPFIYKVLITIAYVPYLMIFKILKLSDISAILQMVKSKPK